MKRKLVKQAGQAITITLPIEWIRENNLKAGNEIELDIIEKNLIIRTGNKTVGKSINLDLSGLEQRSAYSYINASYALGVDEMQIKTDINVYRHLNQNIGYAVVKERLGSYTIKDIGGIGENNLEEIFKQVFQMLISFYEKAISDMFGKSKTDVESIKQMDREINKYTLFLERSIIKHAYDNSALGKIMFAYAFSLEQIGDEIFRAWRTPTEYAIKKDDKLQQIYTLSKNALLKAFELHYQYSNEKLQQLTHLKAEIRNKTMKLRIDNITAQFLSHAIRIVEESNDLVHLILMLRVKNNS